MKSPLLGFGFTSIAYICIAKRFGIVIIISQTLIVPMFSLYLHLFLLSNLSQTLTYRTSQSLYASIFPTCIWTFLLQSLSHHWISILAQMASSINVHAMFHFLYSTQYTTYATNYDCCIAICIYQIWGDSQLFTML